MKLCLALDLASKQENLTLLEKLQDIPNIWVKVGLKSFIRDGKDLLQQIKKINPNFKIFLDLKLYDIPNTMADAAQECTELGVDMITLHTSSGKIAMQAVMQRLQMYQNPPLVLGVTALTSFDNHTFEEIYKECIFKQVANLAKMAFESKLDGVVCSVYESLAVKQSLHQDFLTLTPGIRPFNESSDDQKRIATIAQAKSNKADFIVIGRPIYKAKNPLKTTLNILKEMQTCKS